MGIASLVTNFMHRHDLIKIKELLNIPEAYCFPVMQVALGYIDEEPPQTRKIQTKGVIHYNRYKPADDEDVQVLIHYMDENYPEYISEKYPHALDWFFSEWWPLRYENETYQNLVDAFLRTNLLNEPSLTGLRG